MRKGGTALLSLAALAVLSPDERGFVEDIYLKYEKKLYAEALGITGNRHDAEDAVENAILGVILLRMIYGYTSDEAVKILRVIRANGAGRHGTLRTAAIILIVSAAVLTAALGNETIRANIWNTVASWFSDHIQIGFDDFVETSSVT